MNLDQFIAWANGQSLLWAPSPAREYLRGQCVQLICFYVTKVLGMPILWRDAALWWRDMDLVLPGAYHKVDANNLQRGDIVVWDGSLAGSGGAGHIAIVVDGKQGQPTFISFDSNWGGKYAHLVTHNRDKVLGGLRKARMPIAVAQAQGGDEMIADADQATKIYKMLRPNGNPNQDEINNTVGRRSFASFLNDAQAEVGARDAAIRDQNAQFANMQGIINIQNQTITDLTTKLQNSDATGSEKQAALNAALQKIGETNAELTTCHDTIVDLNNTVTGFENNPVVKAQQTAAQLGEKPSPVSQLIAALIRAFSKIKKQK